MQIDIYRNSILEAWPHLDEAKDLVDVEPTLLRVLWLNNND